MSLPQSPDTERRRRKINLTQVIAKPKESSKGMKALSTESSPVFHGDSPMRNKVVKKVIPELGSEQLADDVSLLTSKRAQSRKKIWIEMLALFQFKLHIVEIMGNDAKNWKRVDLGHTKLLLLIKFQIIQYAIVHKLCLSENGDDY